MNEHEGYNTVPNRLIRKSGFEVQSPAYKKKMIAESNMKESILS